MFTVQVPAKEKKRKSGGATNGRKVKVPQTHLLENSLFGLIVVQH